MENQRIVDLNDAVLAANGGAWDAPPERVVWTDAQLGTALDLIGEHASQRVFGFKDPRTLLVLEGWRMACPGLEFVGIFRDPRSVAQSLAQRSEMARWDGLDLWYHYNRRLLDLYLERPFPLLCFDEEAELFQRKLLAVIESLGLTDAGSPVAFYDDALKTASDAGEGALPWRVRRLYKKLRRVAQ